MNLFVVWNMNTHYLRLYILCHEPSWCMEDEYTYYLCSYFLGHEPVCCVEDEYTLFTFIYLRL